MCDLSFQYCTSQNKWRKYVTGTLQGFVEIALQMSADTASIIIIRLFVEAFRKRVNK